MSRKKFEPYEPEHLPWTWWAGRLLIMGAVAAGMVWAINTWWTC